MQLREDGLEIAGFRDRFVLPITLLLFLLLLLQVLYHSEGIEYVLVRANYMFIPSKTRLLQFLDEWCNRISVAGVPISDVIVVCYAASQT